MVEQEEPQISRQTKHYHKEQDKKEALESNLLGIAGLTLDKLIDLFKEFIRAGNSNPAIGASAVFIVSDILYRSKIIDIETIVIIDTLMGILDGSQIVGSVISDITDITHLFQKSSNAPMELKPSASTIVYADSNQSGDNSAQLVKALLSKKA